jgi:multimeric flavodoxin WrbA
MKITILNGNPDPQQYTLDHYLTQLNQILTAGQHEVTLLNLRDIDIRYCIGCFGCWVKTPGECVSRDESCQVCRAVINSDFTLWASPLRMGFPSALLKKAMDKSIPLIHPYFVVDRGEAHHRPRYDQYPRLGLLLEKENGTDETELTIISDIFSRTALNMKSRLEFSSCTDQPVAALARAITTAEQPGPDFQRHLTATSGTRIDPPTRITVFNGSPRGRKGNTPILLNQFLKGFTAVDGRSYEMYHLNRLREAGQFPQAFANADCVLLGFPLYTDAMPGIVKAFIEQLEPFQNRPGNPPIGFLVQSGFPEAAHSRHIERYLEKLASRLGSPYLGTMVKGNAEGTRLMPDNMNSGLFATLQQLGHTFAQEGRYDPALLKTLAKPERYPAYLAPLFQLFVRLPIASFYWDSQLKQNGAYARRFARPYVSTER